MKTFASSQVSELSQFSTVLGFYDYLFEYICCSRNIRETLVYYILLTLHQEDTPFKKIGYLFSATFSYKFVLASCKFYHFKRTGSNTQKLTTKDLLQFNSNSLFITR